MKKTKLLTLLLVIALAITSVVGGSLAYLQDSVSNVNVMTMGNVHIAQHEYERVVDENGNPVKGVAGEDFTAAYGITESYKLQEFTQGKPALPAVYANGDMAWDEFQQLWNQVGAPGSNDLFDDSMKNVIDKFVFVENTGTFDAYYRTIIAIEAPEGVGEKTIHTSMNANSLFDYNAKKEGAQNAADSDKFYTEINGVRYLIYTATYTDVLKPGEISRPSLLQVYLDPQATNEDCEKFGQYWDIMVISQAVQVQGFENAQTALDTAFGAVDETNVNEWFGGLKAPALANKAEDMEDVLATGGEIILQEDVAAKEIEVAENAKVTIDLNDKTVTTEDGLVNNGEAVIENGNLENTSTGYGVRTTDGGETTYNDVNIETSGGGVNVWGTAVWNDGNVTTNSTSTSARHVFYVAGAEGAQGHLTINGGEFTFSPTNLTRKGSYICAEGADATVIVNGGVFHKPSTRTAPIQALDGATVIIYGGQFQFDPSAFVAEGYEAVEADGWWTVSAK